MVAISTILSQNRGTLKAALSGAFWGLGHTTTLLLTGLAVIAFKLTIPYQLSLSMEFLVGIVLFVLGAQTLRKHQRMRIHPALPQKSPLLGCPSPPNPAFSPCC